MLWATGRQRYLNILLLLVLSLLPVVNLQASEPVIPIERSTIDLITAYNDALKNDPTFAQALAVYLQTVQQVPQARSVLLPQLSLSASASRSSVFTNLTGVRRFNSNSFGASLSQAVFDLNGIYNLKRAKAEASAAELQLAADLQDLIIRVCTAYLNVLQAQDVLRYTKEQRDFVRLTFEVTLARYRSMRSTITDLEFSEGSYKEAEAQYVGAEIALYNSVQQLSQITGVRYTRFATLQSRFPMISPKPANLHAWVESARKNNLSLNSARTALIALKNKITAEEGNYMPVLNAVATWDDVNGAIAGLRRNTGIRQVTKTGLYGLDVSWPIVQGGLTTALVKQYQAEYEGGWGLVRQRFLAAVADTRIAYKGVVSGLKQAYLNRKAVSAYQSSVDNGESAYRSGAISIFNLIQSQSRLFAVQNSYAQSLYSYLLNILVLKQAAGTLAPKNIQELNRLLTPNKVYDTEQSQIDAVSIEESGALNRSVKPSPEVEKLYRESIKQEKETLPQLEEQVAPAPLTLPKTPKKSKQPLPDLSSKPVAPLLENKQKPRRPLQIENVHLFQPKPVQKGKHPLPDLSSKPAAPTSEVRRQPSRRVHRYRQRPLRIEDIHLPELEENALLEKSAPPAPKKEVEQPLPKLNPENIIINQ